MGTLRDNLMSMRFGAIIPNGPDKGKTEWDWYSENRHHLNKKAQARWDDAQLYANDIISLFIDTISDIENPYEQQMIDSGCWRDEHGAMMITTDEGGIHLKWSAWLDCIKDVKTAISTDV